MSVRLDSGMRVRSPHIRADRVRDWGSVPGIGDPPKYSYHIANNDPMAHTGRDPANEGHDRP